MIKSDPFRYLSSAIILSCIFIFQSCKHEPFPVSEIVDGNPIEKECDPDTVYFQNSILPLLISNCSTSGCHDVETAEDNVILVNYDFIMSTGEVEAFDPEESEIYEVITEDDDDDFMPPDPNTPLTNEQIDMIYTWINQGALNNYCASCDEELFTFALSVKPIIDLNCKGCHSGGEPANDLKLETYYDIKFITELGDLEGVITDDVDYAAMPPNGNPLSDCNVQVILNWINAGALDN